MSFFNRKKELPNNLLCLDIGTEFLKVINFEIRNKDIVIHEYLKSRQHTSSMKSGTITSISRVIDNVLETFSQLENQNYAGVIMGIAGELVKGILKEAVVERNSNKNITNEELQEIIDQLKESAQKDAEDLIFLHIADTAGELTNLELINYLIVDTEIDGYRVEDALDLSGDILKIKVFFTFAPSLHVSYLRKVTDAINTKLISIVPQPFAIARAIRGGMDSDYSSIIIDIGGGTTDIGIIQRGVSLGTNMFSFGGRVFTKRIAESLNLTFYEAEEFKIKYSNNKLSPGRHNDIKQSVSIDAPIWAYGVSVGLEEFKPIISGFPELIYLCGGGSLLPDLRDAIIQFPWTSELPFNRSPKVKHLMPEDLDNIIDPYGLFKNVDDITPASIARFSLEILEKE